MGIIKDSDGISNIIYLFIFNNNFSCLFNNLNGMVSKINLRVSLVIVLSRRFSLFGGGGGFSFGLFGGGGFCGGGGGF